MNAIVYNESERAALENSFYWGDQLDPETTEGTLAVRRFGCWSLMTVGYEDGEVNSVLIHNGKIIYNWESNEGETAAPVQAMQELSDRNSKFYSWYLESVCPYSAAKRETEELYSLVTGGER